MNGHRRADGSVDMTEVRRCNNELFGECVKPFDDGCRYLDHYVECMADPACREMAAAHLAECRSCATMAAVCCGIVQSKSVAALAFGDQAVVSGP